MLRSVSTKKTARPQEHEIVDLDVEESVAERVARFLAHQAGARASLSPENHKMIRQYPRLSEKSDKLCQQGAGIDIAVQCKCSGVGYAGLP